jgi:hypothetical protein
VVAPSGSLMRRLTRIDAAPAAAWMRQPAGRSSPRSAHGSPSTCWRPRIGAPRNFLLSGPFVLAAMCFSASREVSWFRSLILLMLLATAWVVVPASAQARSTRTRAIVLHSRFKSLPGAEMVSDQRYVFIRGGSYRTGSGALIDGRTGRDTPISEPGCTPAALGQPWVAFTCGTPSALTYRLYNITTRQTTALDSSPDLGYQACTSNCLPIAAVGRDWIAFEAPPADEHELPTFVFQNLQTGQAVTHDPTSATTTTNLDSPNLTAAICSPLRVPAISNGYSSGWGSLTFDAGYAISSGGGAYLERCRTRLHKRLTFTIPNYHSSYQDGCAHLACPLAANPHAIIWASASDRLAGIFLPSLQPFTIPLPAKVQGASEEASVSYQLALTPRTLYLHSGAGHIWSIPAPVQPKARHR